MLFLLLQAAAPSPSAAEDGPSPLPAFFAWVARKQAAAKLVFQVKGKPEGAGRGAAAPAAAPAPAQSAPAVTVVAVAAEEGCGTQPATLALR